MITIHDEIIQVLDYNEQTGVFTWLKPSWNHTEKKGLAAGTIRTSHCNKQYRWIGVFGKKISAHRLAWFYVHGYFPKQIDHKNGDSLDNRISNLTPCTNTMNAQNHTRKKNKSNLPTGVRTTAYGKFQARITSNKKVYHLGVYSTPELAKDAYDIKRKQLHYCPAVYGG